MSFYINNQEPETIGFNDEEVTAVFYNGVLVWGVLPEFEVNCISFSAQEPFGMWVNNPKWDGIVEYSLDGYYWHEWDGSYLNGKRANATNYVIYLRGTGNTVITDISNYNYSTTNYFRLETLDTDDGLIYCSGNIETLLDYKTVRAGGHPTMDMACFGYMFYECKHLASAPSLPSPTVTAYCYTAMFSGCTNLTMPPALPATNTAKQCYANMFHCCNLQALPALYALELENYCYTDMFTGFYPEGGTPIPGIPLYTTPTGDAVYEYRVPISGTGRFGYNALMSTTQMFDDPEKPGYPVKVQLNTTYYTNLPIIY